MIKESWNSRQTADVSLYNQGGGIISFTSSAVSDTSWLSVLPPAGTTSLANPAQATVTASPGNLSAGTYNGTVTFGGIETGDQIVVPATLVVPSAQRSLILSHSGLAFTSVALGGSPQPQGFAILNPGALPISWTAHSSTLSGGGGWLKVTPTAGAIGPASDEGTSITVFVKPDGLDAGTYYGSIVVEADGAVNSPQIVSVVLNVLSPGVNSGLAVQPAGLLFIGRTDSDPSSQDVTVSSLGSRFGNIVFSPAYSSATGWLRYQTSSGTVTPAASSTVTLQPVLADLPPGPQSGSITVAYSNGEVDSFRKINIVTVVMPTSTGGGALTDCSPLVVVPTSLSEVSSTATVGLPTSIDVRVVDRCGVPLTGLNGSVFAAFDNGDPQLSLIHTGNGNWSGTWTPRTASQAMSGDAVSVVITAAGVRGAQVVRGRAQPAVSVQKSAGAPLTYGAASGASGAATAVAPGALISIYGQGLSDASMESTAPNLPSGLNGTQVLLGNRPLALRYVSDGQVNAQVPFDLPVNTTQQLVVRRGTALSVPQQLLVAPALPGVYTTDGTGSGIGVITEATTGSLVSLQNPAMVGDVVVIYCSGLGEVNPPVLTGTPAPLGGPLSSVVAPVTVEIDGIDAPVLFAGLVPGFPDLYQINAQVPCGTDSGAADTVSVTVTAAQQKSRPVKMPKPGKPAGTPGVQCSSR